jgi:rhodanese-related sulfurtransferase
MILFCASVNAAVPAIPPSALRLLILNKVPDLKIIDVRPPEAFAKSHIVGALNILPEVVDRSGLPKTDHIVVYCTEANCSMSTNAANRLITNGYSKVELLSGGFAEWLKSGYPVQSSVVTHSSQPTSHATFEDAHAQILNGSKLTLDVRPALEFSAGHLPQARNVPLEQLSSELSRLPKDREVVVYDRSPERSRQAVDKLTTAGFKAAELPGGLAGWVKKKYPLEMK